MNRKERRAAARAAGRPARDHAAWSGPRWNGEPCVAVEVSLLVEDAPEFPQYWARDLVGTVRKAVRVTYGAQTFYLDNEDGSGMAKVMNGGGPRWAHRGLSGSEVTS